jgi:hypothetical protein
VDAAAAPSSSASRWPAPSLGACGARSNATRNPPSEVAGQRSELAHDHLLNLASGAPNDRYYAGVKHVCSSTCFCPLVALLDSTPGRKQVCIEGGKMEVGGTMCRRRMGMRR